MVPWVEFAQGFSAFTIYALSPITGKSYMRSRRVNFLFLRIVSPSSIREVWFCDTGPVWLYSNSGAFGSANWAVPSAGEYVVLLVNYNYGSVSGTLSIMAVNTTVAATPISYAMARLPPLA